MIKMRKIFTALMASVTTAAMVFGMGITTYAAGDQSSNGKIPVCTTPGGVFIYGCYYDDFVRYPVYTTDFPEEYLLAIDAAGITNEMSDYEKCVRINDYLCRTVEYGFFDMPSPHMIVGADGILTVIGDNRGGGLGTDVLQHGIGVCSGYSDAFQTMTSMLGIESYTYGSFNLNHGWNAVVIDGVRYFVDVTWNDNETCPNHYLMSTELWADHNAPDLEIKGASPCGWETRQAEEQMEIQAMIEQQWLMNQWILEQIMNNPEVESELWDEEAWSFTEPSVSITRLK